MARKPIVGELSYLLQGAGLFEQMGRSIHENHFFISRAEFVERLFVHRYDRVIVRTNDEKSGRAHLRQRRAG